MRCLLRMKTAARVRLGHPSYSQEGEDRILSRIFDGQRTGFYVDIGSHHPFRFSNTYLFYRRGWRGINIDAMPGSMVVFKRHRQRDINLEMGIASSAGQSIFFLFKEPAFNTFDRALAQKRVSDGCALLGERIVEVRPLREVLDRYLDPHQRIDFMSIDVEGLDLSVLESNDWFRFRPHFLMVESLQAGERPIAEDEVGRFLRSIGYVYFGKTVNTTFYRDSHFGPATVAARERD
ncbi:MAG: FkbM family methyltransferase [Steroidobacteraceae bacterium]